MRFNSVRTVNMFFKSATMADINRLLSEIFLSERQAKVFDMYYMKKKDVCFIADTFCVSPAVIYREIRRIREKILQTTLRKERANN